MALFCMVRSWLEGKMVLVELGIVAAVRRRVVCIDIVEEGRHGAAPGPSGEVG